MELKSIGKFAKRIEVTTIGIGIKEKKKEDRNSVKRTFGIRFATSS